MGTLLGVHPIVPWLLGFGRRLFSLSLVGSGSDFLASYTVIIGGGFHSDILFSPRFLGRWSNLTNENIFQMGGSTTN